MVTSVINSHFHIYHWISQKNSIFHCLFDALFYRSDKLSWNCSSFYRIDKFKPLASWLWLYTQETMTILTSSSGLTNIFTFSLSQSCYCFFIGNLRRANIGINSKVRFHCVYFYFKLQLPNARNYCLACFVVCLNIKCRILFHQPLQR